MRIRRDMLPQFTAMCLSMGLTKPDGSRLDAGETGFIAKQLEYVMAQTYDVEYAPLLARAFIPIDSSVPTGAETFAYDQWDHVGLAKIITAWSDDLPKVEAFVKRFTAQVKHLGLSYEYTLQDIRAVQFSRGRLNDERAQAVRIGIETTIDQLAATGNSAHGLKGFLNHSAIPTYTQTGSAWTDVLDPAVILADLRKLEFSIRAATKQLRKPTTVLFGEGDWSIVNRPIGLNLDKTILQVFLQNSSTVKNADVWSELNAASANGAANRVVMYERNPAVASFVIPQEFEQLPPQVKNLAFMVPCHASVGGVTVKYPLGAGYMDPHLGA